MNNIKWLISVFLLNCLSVSEAKSQTYFKADISSGNVAIDLAAIWASYAINKPKESFVVDNYLTITAFPANVHDDNKKIYITSNSNNLNPFSFKFPAILNGLGTGIKWGYRKQYFSFFKSWALYGSLHGTYNYFTLDMSENGETFESYGNSVIRISPGIGGNLELGKPISSVRVILDVNLRYDLPVFYSGRFGKNAGCMGSGLSPRISLTVGGPLLKRLGMNVGIFYEFMTYNWFKPSDYFIEPYNMKGNTFGINFTMFPWN